MKIRTVATLGLVAVFGGVAYYFWPRTPPVSHANRHTPVTVDEILSQLPVYKGPVPQIAKYIDDYIAYSPTGQEASLIRELHQMGYRHNPRAAIAMRQTMNRIYNTPAYGLNTGRRLHTLNDEQQLRALAAIFDALRVFRVQIDSPAMQKELATMPRARSFFEGLKVYEPPLMQAVSDAHIQVAPPTPAPAPASSPAPSTATPAPAGGSVQPVRGVSAQLASGGLHDPSIVKEVKVIVDELARDDGKFATLFPNLERAIAQANKGGPTDLNAHFTAACVGFNTVTLVVAAPGYEPLMKENARGMLRNAPPHMTEALRVAGTDIKSLSAQILATTGKAMTCTPTTGMP